MKAFLDYYKQADIIPVFQNIPDLSEHFQRRAGLLRQLGVPYRFLTGRRCLEFGPGTGQNALFTLACEPSELVLVDANPASLRETRRQLNPDEWGASRITLVESTIEAYPGARDFDFVLCEGVIPFQNDPASLTQDVAEAVAPGGIMVITCVDGLSYYAEVLRRCLKPLILALRPDEPELDVLVDFFTPDLQALPAMTRRYSDWVQDVILHPYRGGRLYSIADALDTLGEDFDVQGFSPNFLQDWRWFKQMVGDDPGVNREALRTYQRQGSALIDCRVDGQQSLPDAARLQMLCEQAYQTHFDAWDGNIDALAGIVSGVEEVLTLLEGSLKLTAASLKDWCRMVDELQNGRWVTPEAFAGYFGRGQQYVSFIRRESWGEGAA